MGYFSSKTGKPSAAAIKTLQSRDPVMRKLIHRVGIFEIPRSARTFRTLAESIMYQQLSGKAAATIISRWRKLWPKTSFPSPQQVLHMRASRMKKVGVSRQKISYLKDLSRKTLSGYVAIKTLSSLNDEAVIQHLVAVKGIGRWTAEMFLMFALGRHDVFPVDDMGIQKAIVRAYGLRSKPSKDRMQKMAERWRPYRTLASLYLWRSVDQTPLEKVE